MITYKQEILVTYLKINEKIDISIIIFSYNSIFIISKLNKFIFVI